MSSKSTVLSIPGGEHWYQEAVDPRDSVAISIDRASIIEAESYADNETFWFYLKPDSLLAKILSDPDVIEAISKTGYGREDRPQRY